jgi:D-alanyl-lipoteichoic acid acyltransferase DltB (MBOAT superfamily)
MLGFELMKNFDFPYISKTPVEFWQRWHISLSRWFQDYLYFPLAIRYMRRGGWASKYKAHIVAMALIGVWHGANWTFLLFGLYWGVLIASYLAILERTSRAESRGLAGRLVAAVPGVRDFGAIAIMFVLVCVGWVFFRAGSIGDAWLVLARAASPAGANAVALPDIVAVPILWALIAGLCAAEWVYRESQRVRQSLESGRLPAIAGRYALFAAIVVSTGASQLDGARPFIYFQF